MAGPGWKFKGIKPIEAEKAPEVHTVHDEEAYDQESRERAMRIVGARMNMILGRPPDKLPGQKLRTNAHHLPARAESSYDALHSGSTYDALRRTLRRR